jgi:hypothetical protein
MNYSLNAVVVGFFSELHERHTERESKGKNRTVEDEETLYSWLLKEKIESNAHFPTQQNES